MTEISDDFFSEADDTKRLTAEIVAAFVGANRVDADEIPELIRSIYEALDSLSESQQQQEEERPQPAVPIEKSITPDYLICLEDGKKLKMLKRYLRTHYNMTPDEYRKRWGLSSDYPMVAPNYAKRRSEFAKQIGLGKSAGRGRTS
jgi:predicted transcriptional regulator